jgi:hypothetical protein
MKKFTKEECSEILAGVLHDLAPNVSKEDWKKHIDSTAHDAKAFFGDNGEGYNQYLSFQSVNSIGK